MRCVAAGNLLTLNMATDQVSTLSHTTVAQPATSWHIEYKDTPLGD
jgi:hypothetical protein